MRNKKYQKVPSCGILRNKKYTRNEKVLKSFVKYCEQHPEQRFWQALRSWSGFPYVFVGEHLGSEVQGGEDTFYWEGRVWDKL